MWTVCVRVDFAHGRDKMYGIFRRFKLNTNFGTARIES